ncbi:PAS domain-containing protein [Oscillatoria sp. CS-180]|uniref:PAS domain-containing protein n=1 Tax=Oscillatoria sp. CS-180 TaxID=3021720 RepID=UPI00232DC696|nr:PAS domain-containing protein [Oscillatoria sp. CS-180]MDB9528076.1 PAS domain-containing protein [Oscillatoria sp. CS-180]
MGIPLRSLLTIPFLLQFISITSLAGFLSHWSGQQTIREVADQLTEEAGNHVVYELGTHLQAVRDINVSHAAAIQSGLITSDNLDQLHHYLALQLFKNRTISALIFGTAQGDSRAVYRTDETIEITKTIAPNEVIFRASIADQNRPLERRIYSINNEGDVDAYLETTEAIDVRSQPWYQNAVSKGQIGWSDSFQIAGTNHSGISAYTPIYDQDRRLEGVFSVSISFCKFNELLKRTRVSKNGRIVVFEQTGLKIADSSDKAVYRDEQAYLTEQLSSHYTVQSSDPVLDITAQYLQQISNGNDSISSGYESTIRVQKELYFLKIFPYQDPSGLDLQIAVLLPQSDFAGQIYADVRRLIIFYEIALVSSFASITLVARRITQPLRRLISAAHAYAAGGIPQPLRPIAIQEIESLRLAFEKMMVDLDAQRQEIDVFRTQYEQSLEHQIAERTSALVNTTHQLQAAQRIAHVGSWELDIATHRMTCSEELFHVIGRSMEEGELTVDEILKAIHPEDRKGVRQAVVTAISEGTAYDMELRVLTPDHQTRYLINRGEVLSDERGQALKLVGTATDISDRKKNELMLQKLSRELSEWRERYEIVIRAGKQTIFEYDLLTERYTWDSNFQTILGYTPKEAPQTLVETQKLVHPDDLPLLQRIRDRASTISKPYTVEVRLQRKDGEYVWVEDSGTIQRNEQGQPIKIVGSLKDVSDQKEAELALQESVSMLRQITENLPLFFGLRGVDTRDWLYVNSAFETITGYSTRHMYEDAEFYKKLVHPEDLRPLRRKMAARATHQPREQTFRIIKADRKSIWIRMVEFPVYSQQGEVSRVAVFAEDITHRKQAELELKLLNAQLQELATTDSLTKIANRRQFVDRLQQAWLHHQRECHSLTLIMIDIDHFKNYNDCYGHPKGDQCLFKTAQLLRRCVHRPGDLVARYGGEEFVILLSNTQREGAIAIAQRIQREMKKLAIPHQASPISPIVTFSLGIAVIRMPNAIGYERAIVEADKMLYQAKQIRNNYRVVEVD